MSTNHLIKELNQIREENGQSILSVAESSQMHYPAVYRIFKGQRMPQIDTFEHILNSIGYTLKIVPKEQLKTPEE